MVCPTGGLRPPRHHPISPGTLQLLLLWPVPQALRRSSADPAHHRAWFTSEGPSGEGVASKAFPSGPAPRARSMAGQNCCGESPTPCARCSVARPAALRGSCAVSSRLLGDLLELLGPLSEASRAPLGGKSRGLGPSWLSLALLLLPLVPTGSPSLAPGVLPKVSLAQGVPRIPREARMASRAPLARPRRPQGVQNCPESWGHQ